MRAAPPICGSCGGYGPLLRCLDRNPELFPCALEELPHRVDQLHERYPSSGDASLAVGSNVIPAPRDGRGEEESPLAHDLSEDEGADPRGDDAQQCAPHRQAPSARRGALGAGCRTFQATGITDYLGHGGILEHAQAIGAHNPPRTTKLYDRTGDVTPLDQVEKITIWWRRRAKFSGSPGIPVKTEHRLKVSPIFPMI
jgi:hypothetical protein